MLHWMMLFTFAAILGHFGRGQVRWQFTSSLHSAWHLMMDAPSMQVSSM